MELKLEVRRTVLTGGVLLTIALAPAPRAQQTGTNVGGGSRPAAAVALAPTNHPVLPRDLSRLWFVPGDMDRIAARVASVNEFATAMRLAAREGYAKALPILSQASTQQGPLGEHAIYYAGLAELQLGRQAEACRLFRRVQERGPIGYLVEAAALAEAECAEAAKDYGAAIAIYERLLLMKTTAPDEILMRLGGAAKADRDFAKAGMALGRVYFEFPQSRLAPLAGSEYASLPIVQRIAPGTERYKLELGRAERLFRARLYAEALQAYETLRASASGDDGELVNLRIAECHYFQGRLRDARDGVKPYISKASRQAEALFFHALAVGDLGDRPEYFRTVRRIVTEFQTERWAEEALDNLATRYIRGDEDAQADAAFRELYKRYPLGAYAPRAAWKIGWGAYRAGRYAETVRYFERAASDFPRSDYRPSWLYWAGRARDQLKERALAGERYRLVTSDYLNSYYGRLAVARLDGRTPPRRVVGEPTAPLPPPPTEALVRTLLGIGRYDDALSELQYAQRVWGDSPAIQATVAWIYQRKGQLQTGVERFNLLRGSITTMRRAYPQFLAAGGQELPREILTVIFPIAYWDLIQRHSSQLGLDPYLVAALVAQESTFVPDIRSSANAVGLMQLVSSTARQYARKLKLRYSRRLATNPEANIRMGTAYLADKLKEFGDLHLALASYNAGERVVRRWIAERPGLTDREEFIDDIPYSETRNYVKRILGTAEDYRRLYSR